MGPRSWDSAFQTSLTHCVQCRDDRHWQGRSSWLMCLCLFWRSQSSHGGKISTKIRKSRRYRKLKKSAFWRLGSSGDTNIIVRDDIPGSRNSSGKGAPCWHGIFSKCHVGKKSHVDMRFSHVFKMLLDMQAITRNMNCLWWSTQCRTVWRKGLFQEWQLGYKVLRD